MALESSIVALISQKTTSVVLLVAVGTGSITAGATIVANDIARDDVRVIVATDDTTTTTATTVVTTSTPTSFDTADETTTTTTIDGGVEKDADLTTEPISCDEARNHGEYVAPRAQAKDGEKGSDRSMAEIAWSDCGKPEHQEDKSPDDSEQTDVESQASVQEEPAAKSGNQQAPNKPADDDSRQPPSPGKGKKSRAQSDS